MFVSVTQAIVRQTTQKTIHVEVPHEQDIWIIVYEKKWLRQHGWKGKFPKTGDSLIYQTALLPNKQS
jgi:hypothetical protein